MSGLPVSAVLDPSTGLFSWTPGYNDSGIYTVEFVVSDSLDGNASESINITVVDVNRAPVLTSIGSRTVEEGSKLTFTLDATDADGDDLTYFGSNMPSNATLNATSGVFAWTPVKGEAGTYNVTFGVTDGHKNITETVAITVKTVSSTSGTSGSSGSGGGGGGGGATSTSEKYENIDFKDFVLKSVVKDTATVFTFYKENNSIVSVSFTSKLNGGQVKAVVEMLKGTSSQVRSSAPGDVYRNMNIYVDSNLAPSVIGNSKIDFKVEKSWIYNNEVEISTITLCRYSGNSWVQLPTTVIGEDEYYYYFTSTTPGFSPFAISSVLPQIIEQVGESAVSGTEALDSLMSPEDTMPVEPVNPANQESKTGFPFMLIIGLVLLMLIGIFGYRNRDYYDKVRMQLGNPDGKRYRRIKNR
jgi:PGF-pre-PGF domain-containing protein